MNVRELCQFFSNYFCGVFRFSSQDHPHFTKIYLKLKYTYLGQITDRQTPKHHPWNRDVRSVYKRNISLIGQNSRNHGTKYRTPKSKLNSFKKKNNTFLGQLFLIPFDVLTQVWNLYLVGSTYEFMFLIILIALILRYHRLF